MHYTLTIATIEPVLSAVNEDAVTLCCYQQLCPGEADMLHLALHVVLHSSCELQEPCHVLEVSHHLRLSLESDIMQFKLILDAQDLGSFWGQAGYQIQKIKCPG